MTTEEILAFLRIESLDEAADALETELFEIRKTMLSKPLLRLTLRSKLARLHQLAEIARALQLFSDCEDPEFRYDPVRSEEVLVLWEGYMKAKSSWKMTFMQTQTPEGLAGLLEAGLKMETAFSEQFPERNWTEEEPVFGLEPDPMPVQNGLKLAAQKGWLTFADLEKNKTALEKDLLLAIKRLSLLPKYLS